MNGSINNAITNLAELVLVEFPQDLQKWMVFLCKVGHQYLTF
jgi:hypothetical protein